MFEAQRIFSSEKLFSPWMSRGGDNVIFTADVIYQSDNKPDLSVQLYEKNTEDPGDGTAITGSISGDATGRFFKELKGVKELVRYRFTLTSTTAEVDHVLFRMLSPVWFDDVEGSDAT